MYYLIEQTSQRNDELGAYIVALRGRKLQSGKWLLRTLLEKGQLRSALKETLHSKADSPTITIVDESEAERLLVDWLGPEEPPLEEVGS
jgi:hypothetical protein